ncbi:unnamed protein product [Pylaiella littoralis]
MMATRPTSSRQQPSAAAAAAATSSHQEEKNIPGVRRDALKEERKPLLDLDDVDLFESELAACFDAPPPPPLNIGREEQQQPTAAAIDLSWAPPARTTTVAPERPRYVETYVAPPTASAVAAARARGELPGVQEEQQEQEQEQVRGARGVSDFSSLYVAAPHRAGLQKTNRSHSFVPQMSRQESTGQLYPALVPSAPPVDVTRALEPHAAAASAAAAVAAEATVATAISTSSSSRPVDAEAARGATEIATSEDVVEELLSENERLRLIIQDMSDELDRVSVQGRGGALSAASAVSTAMQARGAAATRSVSVATVSATRAQRLLGRYPGAQAEALRRQREQGEQKEQEQEQEQPQQQQEHRTQPQAQTSQTLGPGMSVHFKCENCPQWLKVPGQAQLVYCPLCGHTSQMTANSTIHYPPNNEVPSSANRSSTGTAGAGAGTGAGGGTEEEVGWIGYFKSILAS